MPHPAATPDLRPVETPEEAVPPNSTSAVQVRPATPSARTRLVGLQRYWLVTLAVVAVIGALKVAEGFFVPVIFGVVLALALAPLVRRLEWLMPRWLASAFAVIVLVGLLGFMAY